MQTGKKQMDGAMENSESGLKERLKKKGEAAREKILSATKAFAKKPRGAAKGEAARKKILAAARTVFARHPYNAASIRMIAREGGFDHPLIHYYFPTKAMLFEEVAKQMYDEFLLAQNLLERGLMGVTPQARLTAYIDRSLQYGFANRETLGVLMQNMAQTDRIDEIPGYHYIHEVFAQLRSHFVEQFPVWMCEATADKLIYSFTMLIFVYVGTTCQAQVMGMDFGSDQYRQWVKEALQTVFQPVLEKALSESGERSGAFTA